MRFTFVFRCKKNEDNSDNENHCRVFTLFLLIMLMFLLQDNAIPLHLESLKEQLVFHNLRHILKHKQDMFFFFIMQNIESNRSISFSQVFSQSSFTDVKFIPSNLYLLIKGFILLILCISFLLLQDLMRLLQHIESIYYIFLLIRFIVAFLFFIQSREYLYDPILLGFIL